MERKNKMKMYLFGIATILLIAFIIYKSAKVEISAVDPTLSKFLKPVSIDVSDIVEKSIKKAGSGNKYISVKVIL